MGFNYAIDILGLVITVYIMLSERKSEITGNIDQKLFRVLLHILTLIFAVDIPAWLLDGHVFAGSGILLTTLNTIYYTAQILYCYFWILFSVYWNKKAASLSPKLSLALAIPCVAELLLIITNPFTGWVFNISENNVYTRGSMYYFNLAPYFLYVFGALAFSVVSYFRYKDELQKKKSLLFAVYMILPICGTLLQSFYYGVSLLWPFTVLSLLMIYINVQQDAISQSAIIAAREAQKAAVMQNELTQARISIMLSQIQPHFLYNALCVIQDLCHGKAPEAEQATVEFSEFLRGNLDSLSSQNTIPFEQELKHTNNYLALEKKRFGDRLNIVCNIMTTAFRIPPLVLQPIAENAVRYGVCQREEGGTIWISSGEDENSYLVTVRDNGMGFDIMQPKKDGRTHIGISNVKERLEKMCGGSLEITTTPGVGTVAIISIPKEEE